MNISTYLAGAAWEEILAVPVAVPSTYLMLHSHWWPVVPGDAPPFDTAAMIGRTHDSAIGGWRGIETEPGVYDWSGLDAFVEAFGSVCLTVYGTPEFYAVTHVEDPYGDVGASSPPRALCVLYDFVVAACSRHRDAIRFVECWNEPDGGFFHGTMTQLADMCATIKSAAKAGNGARVLSPAFVHPQDRLAAFMSAQGHQSEQYGRDTFDDLAVHSYGALPFPDQGGDDLAWSGTGGLVRARRLLESMNRTNAIHVTEFGFGTAGSAPLERFMSLPEHQRRQVMAGSIITAAAYGAQTFGLYSFNSGLCGDLAGDTNGAIAGIADAQAFLESGLIVSLKHHGSGRAVAVNNDGDSYAWSQ